MHNCILGENRMTLFTSAPASICVLRLSAIGDCCHAIALIQKIQQHWPETKITWVIGKIEAQLIGAIPNLGEVELIIFDKKEGRRAYKKLKSELEGRSFDVLLHLQANFRANLVSRCISSKNRIGFGFKRARELQWLFTNIKAPISGEHVAEGFMDFATALGLPPSKPNWNIDIPQELLNWAKQYKDGRPLLVLCPAASKAERNWTTEGYAAVINHAHHRAVKVILIGSPAPMEVELAKNISLMTSLLDENLVGKTSLAQLLALIKTADIVVAPDTGPAHMATIVGTPVLGLYAAQSPARTGPYLYKDQAVSVYDEALFAETGKTAEQVPWRTRVKDKNAMARIKTDTVIKRLDAMLDATKK